MTDHRINFCVLFSLSSRNVHATSQINFLLLFLVAFDIITIANLILSPSTSPQYKFVSLKNQTGTGGNYRPLISLKLSNVWGSNRVKVK